ncbi:DNA (cytosine-5)-methyltransferase CMT3 isoform X2 [Pyrus x bretschneideri]|uniref:DNA (cytosine-5)-methyltransferase CMT3 isoform X2 n=1 Tax=Pyrus x bretschneideri TaxID=225117 RepID=UPI00202E1AE4|nr:DNA (cytosine-5)-methyltransferase CMT3 isoform X2 [Pyrus x bretschneideri]
MACKRKSKAGTSSGSPPKSKSPRQTKKARVEEEVATSVEKATSPPKSKKTRQTKKKRVEEEVATSVEKSTSPLKAKSPRLTRSARVEEEVATSVEKADCPPKSKNTRQTRKTRVEEEVATSVEKAASPLKSKKTRQTKEGGVEEEVAASVEKSTCSPKSKKPRQTKNARVEEEVATSVEIAASPTKLKNPRQTNKATVEEEAATSVEKAASPLRKSVTQEVAAADEDGEESRFIGKPMEDEEARKQYPKRYAGEKPKRNGQNNSNDDEDIIQARCHYTKALVDGITYDLYDDAHVQGETKEEPFICKIVEMFEAIGGLLYFTAQWYYRSRDTVIKHCATVACGRVFFSDVRDDNPLDCLVEKLHIVRLTLNVDQDVKSKSIPVCNYYCDTKYLLPYSTFVNLPTENMQSGSDDSTISVEDDVCLDSEVDSKLSNGLCAKSEVRLLDLYSGCGAMSTGLCLGAHLANVNLVTRWAVDYNEYACKSLEQNHPETEVRNEAAEDFLTMLKEWRKLCMCLKLVETDNLEEDVEKSMLEFFRREDDEEEDEEEEEEEDVSGNENDDSEVFEVDCVVGVCFGDPKKNEKKGIYFKIHWKGYGPEEDTWEPMNELEHCKKAIKGFITEGYRLKKLPLPGDVDVVCGGPPCQGVSGFNRFRNTESPLADEKNQQLEVYMDIVQYLKPKFVLMENVVDILKFADGFLGRYALGRLVDMNYQARMGMMAAGAYGLPQFRMRVFLWGARPTEILPQYPLPTHDVISRGVIPTQFEGNAVAYDEGQKTQLAKSLYLEDAISDLPAVKNNEERNEMPYGGPPKTEFQRLIRLSKEYLMGTSRDKSLQKVLYDHRPLQLNPDDYARVCEVPKRKGACFRDFPGVRVRGDNKVEWDPEVPRVYLASGKPLVPDYAMSFVKGSSSKPFARLWWDETVPTVVTRAEPHNQAIMHPEQDRVLTIRENARLQGFPDFYRLSGPVKERYMQVGNAVAVPVARALGYALGLALRRSAGADPVFILPESFPNIQDQVHSASSEEAD